MPQPAMPAHHVNMCSHGLYSERDVEYPEHFDCFHLVSEIDATDKTALEAVLEVDSVRIHIEQEIDRIMDEDGKQRKHSLVCWSLPEVMNSL